MRCALLLALLLVLLLVALTHAAPAPLPRRAVRAELPAVCRMHWSGTCYVVHFVEGGALRCALQGETASACFGSWRLDRRTNTVYVVEESATGMAWRWELRLDASLRAGQAFITASRCGPESDWRDYESPSGIEVKLAVQR